MVVKGDLRPFSVTVFFFGQKFANQNMSAQTPFFFCTNERVFLPDPRLFLDFDPKNTRTFQAGTFQK